MQDKNKMVRIYLYISLLSEIKKLRHSLNTSLSDLLPTSIFNEVLYAKFTSVGIFQDDNCHLVKSSMPLSVAKTRALAVQLINGPRLYGQTNSGVPGVTNNAILNPFFFH